MVSSLTVGLHVRIRRGINPTYELSKTRTSNRSITIAEN